MNMNNVWLHRVIMTVLACCCPVFPLCLVGDFDEQVQQLRSRLMLSRDELTKLFAVFGDLQDTLQTQWPGSKVLPVGSAITGLTTKWSDADCMATVPNYNTYNNTANRYLITQAVSVLQRHPKLYQDVRAKFRPKHKVSVLKFTYVPSQRNCDLNFISTLALDTSKMIGDFYSLDDRVITLVPIVKYWSKVHGLDNASTMSGYSLTLLIIFYFQQEKILPSYYLIQRSLDPKNDFGGKSYNSKSLYELLGGFFEYYSEFNFDEYVASPLTGHAIHKKEFEDFNNLPEELSSYKEHMNSPNSSSIQMNTSLCIQDVFEPHINTAVTTTSDDAASLLLHFKLAARAYYLLPEEDFLTAILVKDTNSETVVVTNTWVDYAHVEICDHKVVPYL